MAETLGYLELLPTDIIMLLTIYLDYPTTLNCFKVNARISKICETDNLWITKIREELGLPPIQYLPTLIPLNQKYIELKSIIGVDIGLLGDPVFGGSEYFLDPYQFVSRAARLYNHVMRRNALEYYYQNYRIFFKQRSTEAYSGIMVYELIITGLVLVDDNEL